MPGRKSLPKAGGRVGAACQMSPTSEGLRQFLPSRARSSSWVWRGAVDGSENGSDATAPSEMEAAPAQQSGRSEKSSCASGRPAASATLTVWPVRHSTANLAVESPSAITPPKSIPPRHPSRLSSRGASLGRVTHASPVNAPLGAGAGARLCRQRRWAWGASACPRARTPRATRPGCGNCSSRPVACGARRPPEDWTHCVTVTGMQQVTGPTERLVSRPA